MVTRRERAKAWPRTKSGRPIFKNTNEALFYANLIWDDPKAETELEFFIGKLREKIKDLREQDEPNLDKMMSYAVQAQLYRECIQEIGSIYDDPYTAPPDFHLEEPT